MLAQMMSITVRNCADVTQHTLLFSYWVFRCFIEDTGMVQLRRTLAYSPLSLKTHFFTQCFIDIVLVVIFHFLLHVCGPCSCEILYSVLKVTFGPFMRL